jgi:hypothetical protein
MQRWWRLPDSVWVLGVCLLGNNRALMARRFDRAFTTVLGIAVTMIALVRAS